MLTFIERAARDPSFDINKFSVLLDRQESLLRQHQAQMYDAAYTEMQEELTDIKRSGRNPTFQNPYAKLEDLDAAARPIWSKYGFSVRYGTKPCSREGWMTETIVIAHRGGHREFIELSAPIDFQNSGYRSRTPVQAVGSTITYLRRYLLQMGLNLVPHDDPDDDDGEGQRPQRNGPVSHQREGSHENFTASPSDEEASFKAIAIETAKGGHNALSELWRNSSKRNRQRILDWKDELASHYPATDEAYLSPEELAKQVNKGGDAA